jgi:hypothetical protein
MSDVVVFPDPKLYPPNFKPEARGTTQELSEINSWEDHSEPYDDYDRMLIRIAKNKAKAAKLKGGNNGDQSTHNGARISGDIPGGQNKGTKRGRGESPHSSGNKDGKDGGGEQTALDL